MAKLGSGVGLRIYRRLLGYVLQYRQYLALAILGLIFSAATQSVFAWIMGPLLDKAILERDPEVIGWLPLGIIAIFLVRGVAMFTASYFMGLLGRLITQQIRNEVFTHMLRLPIRYFEQHTQGKLLAHIIYYTEHLSGAGTRGLTVLVQDTLTILGLLGVMFYHSWQLTLGTLLVVPAIALVVVYVTKRIRRISHQVQDSMGEVTQVSNEMLGAYRVVRIFNGETFESQRFAEANQRNLNLQMKRLVTELVSTPVVQFLVALALAAIIWLATRPGTLETLSPGSFMSFIMAMMLILAPIRSLTQLNTQLQAAIAAGESIFALLDAPPEQDQGQLALKRCQGHVKFTDVHFSYPQSDKKVLDAINFEVLAGQRVAFVGRSGSGKTTLVNLLARFHNIEQGSIQLDGYELETIRLPDLRQQIAYVGQDIVLFNDTVRNNIAYGQMRSASDAAVWQAVEAAYAREFIEQLPQGLDTMIGENGVMLSGGQRQRLSIARAILADAPLLILDEATSALDTESERHIQAALEALMHNRTTFMIAHRLSTIENADQILVMQDGCIVERGTHQDLLDLEGYYARLHGLQFQDA